MSVGVLVGFSFVALYMYVIRPPSPGKRASVAITVGFCMPWHNDGRVCVCVCVFVYYLYRVTTDVALSCVFVLIVSVIRSKTVP